MKQVSETLHQLEMRNNPCCPWGRGYDEELFRPAVILAYKGRLIEAIEEAQKIQIQKFGNMNGVRFRCVTQTKTVTITGGPFEDAIEQSRRG